MSKLFLGGLVSGMSTDDVIRQLLQVEASRGRSHEVRKAQATARQTAWRDIDASLTRLNARLDAIKLPSAFQAKKATLSNEAVAAITVRPDAMSVSHELQVTQLARTHMVGGRTEANPNLALGLSGTVHIRGQALTVTAEDTLHSVRDKLNAHNAMGVRAEVARVMNGTSLQYRLVLHARASGEAAAIALGEIGKGPTDAELALAQGLGIHDGTKLNTLISPKDAEFRLNGLDYRLSSNVIDDILPGVTINLRDAGNTTVTVSDDTDRVVTAVQELVAAWNSTMSLLADRSQPEGEGRTRGPLYGESVVRRLQDRLRGMVTMVAQELPDGINRLTDIGIGTGAFRTADFGRITLDKTRLQQRLQADAIGVAKLLGAMPHNTALGRPVVADGQGAVDLTDGIRDTARAGSPGGGWESASPTATARVSLEASWIDRIDLTIPDADQASGLQNYELWYQQAGAQGSDGWHRLTAITDHMGQYRSVSFDRVHAQAVELRVLSTYNGTSARVTELEVFTESSGLIPRLGEFLADALRSETGLVSSRQAELNRQMRQINQQIDRVNERVAAQEQVLRKQFARMEKMLSKLQAQGNAFTSQIMGLTPQSRR